MLNRVIYEGLVYYRAEDIRFELQVSAYKFKKLIAYYEIETRTLKGFGRSKFILEGEACSIVTEDDFSLDLGTEVKCKEVEMENCIRFTKFANMLSGKDEFENIYSELDKVHERFDKAKVEVVEREFKYENFNSWNNYFKDNNIGLRYVNLNVSNNIIGKYEAINEDVCVLVDAEMNIICGYCGEHRLTGEVQGNIYYTSYNYDYENDREKFETIIDMPKGDVSVDAGKFIKNMLTIMKQGEFGEFCEFGKDISVNESMIFALWCDKYTKLKVK